MRHGLRYSLRAVKDLSSFSKIIADRITKKLRWFTEKADPMAFATKLSTESSLYRFRIGEYRAVFQKDDDGEIILLTIVRIGHRREIYRNVD